MLGESDTDTDAAVGVTTMAWYVNEESIQLPTARQAPAAGQETPVSVASGLLGGTGVRPASDGAAADDAVPAMVSRIASSSPFASAYCPTPTQSLASAHDAAFNPGPAGDVGAGFNPDSEAAVVAGPPEPPVVVTVSCRPVNPPCGYVYAPTAMHVLKQATPVKLYSGLLNGGGLILLRSTAVVELRVTINPWNAPVWSS